MERTGHMVNSIIPFINDDIRRMGNLYKQEIDYCKYKGDIPDLWSFFADCNSELVLPGHGGCFEKYAEYMT